MNDSKKRERFWVRWVKRSRSESIRVGDYVNFTSEAIAKGKETDDVWNGLVGKVKPEDRFKVIGKDMDGNFYLEGWNITCENESKSIPINPLALKKSRIKVRSNCERREEDANSTCPL